MCNVGGNAQEYFIKRIKGWYACLEIFNERCDFRKFLSKKKNDFFSCTIAYSPIQVRKSIIVIICCRLWLANWRFILIVECLELFLFCANYTSQHVISLGEKTYNLVMTNAYIKLYLHITSRRRLL